MRPKIETHDYDFKKKHIVEFLEHGDKVKVTLMFRGREMAHTELGRKLLDQLSSELSELAKVEAPPKQEGRNMTMLLTPNATKPKSSKKAADKEPAADEEAAPEEAEATRAEGSES